MYEYKFINHNLAQMIFIYITYYNIEQIEFATCGSIYVL